LRAPIQEEHEAAGQFSQALRSHLTSLVGDIRSHIITNVNLGKKAGILMKVIELHRAVPLPVLYTMYMYINP
jgi:hypothetical protein